LLVGSRRREAAGMRRDEVRCLGHALPSIRGVYDQHDYVPQMKLAFEALAALIETIVAPKPNVVPLRG
jgi:hypothetical protein